MPAATSTPSAEFEAAWEEFFLAARRARARAAKDQPGGLSLAHLQLLSPLADGDPRTVGELAAGAAMAGPTATRMLDGLERDGVVTRDRSPTDRRSVAIALTPRGAGLLAAKRRAVTAKRERVFRSLTAAEQAGAAELLQRMAGVLEEL